MRAILLLFPALLVSCGPTLSQREILRRSKIEVATREAWSDSAVLVVNGKPSDYMQPGWVVKAGAYDLGAYPRYQGLHFVPGTERELRFTRDGCLISYRYAGSCCHYPLTPAPIPAPAEAE